MKKNRLIFSLLLVCLSATLLRGQSIPEVLYYKFNESGTSVTNYASAPPVGTNVATIMGGVTQGGTGICGGTLIGSGASSTSDYLNTGWAPNLGTSSWTISFRTSGISTNATLYYIFGDLNTTQFRCFTNGVAGSTNWIIRGAGMTDVYINGGALSTPTMCTYVYDNTLGNIKGYLNGVLVTTVAQGAVNITGTGPFKVMGYSANVGAPAGGLLDEFRFYSRALTDVEVAELYNPFATAGFLGPDQPICPSSPIQLELAWPASSVLWSDGSTLDSILIDTAATFNVSVSGTCGSGMDTITFISTATSSAMTPSSCGDYTSPSGLTYTMSGLYSDTITNAAGCDSVISIDLVINTATTNTLNPTLCAANYIAPSGAVYSTSGTYMDTISNAAGCDSLITINLNLDASSSSSISPTSCGSYMAPSGSIHNTTSTFNDTIPNFNGCDSIITINLTINAANINVNQTGSSGQNLASAATGTYQWIDCGTLNAVPGATNQTFIASGNGMYAVIVTQNGCTDTSACYTVSGLGINSNPLAELIKLYPNPTTGAFTINVGLVNESFTIELINNVGQVIKNSLYNNTNLGTFEIEGPAGLYFVRVTDSHGEKVSLRIIKE